MVDVDLLRKIAANMREANWPGHVLEEAADEIEQLRDLLRRTLGVVDSGHWRDVTEVNLSAAPLWGDVRDAILTQD